MNLSDASAFVKSKGNFKELSTYAGLTFGWTLVCLFFFKNMNRILAYPKSECNSSDAYAYANGCLCLCLLFWDKSRSLATQCAARTIKQQYKLLHSARE